MSEEQAKEWMNRLAGEVPAGLLPDPNRIWLRAQLDDRFEPRRKAAAVLIWVDAAVHSAIGLALAGLSLWLVGW